MKKVKNLAKRINRKYSPGRLLYSPDWIVLGVNNICNLHCKMCDVGTKNLDSNFATNLVGTHPINMPIPLIKDVFDQTSRYFPNSKIGYGFTEPLVYPHLIESLEYANSKNLYTSITTNALTLSHKAEALVNAGLNDLFISLDGPEDVHNVIRGHKSSFQRAIKGIEKILELDGGPQIGVFCVITEWNIGRLTEFLEYFKDFPLNHLGFMHTNFTTQGVADIHNREFGNTYPATDSNIDEINVDNMDLNVVWEEIQALKRSKYPFPVSISPDLNSKNELIDFYHNPEQKLGKKCHDAFNNIMVKSDGTVIPAHGRCYNLPIGNIYNEDLKTIWNSSVISQFRKTLNENGGLLPACSRCCSGFGK